jgi:hypothetical protein
MTLGNGLEPVKRRRKRRKRSKLDKIGPEVRRMKRRFEKELSQFLSDHFGFEITAKIKRQGQPKKQEGDTTSLSTMERRSRGKMTVYDLADLINKGPI